MGDGVAIRLSVSDTVLTDRIGNPMGMVSVGRNLSRRRVAEQQLRRAVRYAALYMNDARGHTSGDALLRAVIGTIRDSLRPKLRFAEDVGDKVREPHP